MKQHLIRILIYGFFVWLIPFAVSIPFYTPDGNLRTDIYLFKTVMILTGSFTGCLLTVSLALKISGKRLPILVSAGWIWLFLNWGLDFLVLVPLSKMDGGTYFLRIGLGYLTMVFVPTAVGYVADRMVSEARGE